VGKKKLEQTRGPQLKTKKKGERVKNGVAQAQPGKNTAKGENNRRICHKGEKKKKIFWGKTQERGKKKGSSS